MAKRSQADGTASSRRVRDAEFLAALCHELRGPLGAIGTWLHVLGSGQADVTTGRQALAAIERGVRAQASLVEQLSELSLAQAGRLPLAIATVDLQAVALSAVATARAAALDPQRSIDYEPSAAVVVRADPARLQQIVALLLECALRAHARDGRVVVRVARKASRGELTVRGLRAGPASSLPIALAREIVELQQGRLEVATEDGQLQVSLRLPLSLRTRAL